MKKLIAVLLVIMLIPAVSMADYLDYVGCYVYYELLTTGAPQMTMFYLAPGHVSYYLVQSYHENEPGIGRAYVGKWEVNMDGTIFVKTGNNTSMTLIIPDGASVAYNQDLNQCFINISLYDNLIK